MTLFNIFTDVPNFVKQSYDSRNGWYDNISVNSIPRLVINDEYNK